MVTATQAPEHDQPATEHSADAMAQNPSDFSRVARRITGWTSNLLASALVLVITLAAGRQLSEWLRAAPSESPEEIARPPADLTAIDWDQDGPLFLEFGEDKQTIWRGTIRGNRKTAIDELHNQCRMLVNKPAAAMESPGPAECRLLNQLARLAPTEQQSGNWAIFELNDAIPMVAGTRQVSENHRGESTDSSNQFAQRLVACGLAIPATDESWLLFMFRATRAAEGTGDDSRIVPLPPGGSHTLSLRSRDGRVIMAIKGSVSVLEWIRFYEHWLGPRGWKSTQGWSKSGNSWHARYSTDQPTPTRLDIQLCSNEQGLLTGILSVTPSPNDSIER